MRLLRIDALSSGGVEEATLNDSGHVVAEWNLWPARVARRIGIILGSSK